MRIKRLIVVMLLAITTISTSSGEVMATGGTSASLNLTLSQGIGVMKLDDDTDYTYTTPCDSAKSTETFCYSAFSLMAKAATVTIWAPEGSTLTWSGSLANCSGLTCTFQIVGDSPINASVSAKLPASTPSPSPVSTPAPSPKTVSSPTPTPTKVATSQPATEPIKTSPIMSEVSINNTSFSEDSNMSYGFGEDIIVSGKTNPGARVHLFIYSTLREADTIANADGKWSYAITDLEPGDHHIETAVTTADGATSEKKQIAAFTVKSAPPTALKTTDQQNADTAKNKSLSWLYIAVGVLFAILALATVMYVFYKKRQKSKALQTTTPTYAQQGTADQTSIKPSSNNPTSL